MENIGRRWVVESADNEENFWCDYVVGVQEMTYVLDHKMHWQFGTHKTEIILYFHSSF